jgi:hypothetical protein
MDRCCLLVEGQTEETFANRTLLPHLYVAGFHRVSVTVLATKRVAGGGKYRGGLTAWSQLRTDINLLVRDQGAVVTTMVDLYALPNDVPGSVTVAAGATPRERVDQIEREIRAAIAAPNLVPHVMLHEFEALLYADPQSVARHFDDESISVAMSADLQQCGEPELVNDGPSTAPSKRIIRHRPTYLKTTDGPTILDAIGLPTIRQACPHFDEWLTTIESHAP